MAKKKVINNNNLNSDLIGGSFTNIASETIFNFGNFKLTTNFTGKENRDYSNELSSFVTPITLETLGADETLSNIVVEFTTNAQLNLDHSDIKSYVRFGSVRELIRVAIEDIIEKYPASLFVDSQLRAGGATTVQNYSYDPLTDVCNFAIPSDYITNNFGLIFNEGNTSTFDGNDLKNLNLSFEKYNIWRVDNPENERHNIIGFTGDSQSVAFVRIEAVGNPFPEISGGSNSTSVSYHLKPEPQYYNRFKLDLNQLQNYFLDDRKEDRSGFAIPLKVPNIQETGIIIYTTRIYLWSTTDGYNIEINTSSYQRFLDAILNLGNAYDTAKTDLIARFLTPESLKLYDLTDEGKMTKLLRIYGAEFDQLRSFIDGLVTINKVSYDKVNNAPDQILKNLARTMGWDPFVLVSEEQFVNSFFNLEEEDKKGDLLPAEVDLELWRRILINTNYFWKSKGTTKALKAILLLIGIPEPFINITEYIYTVEGRIDPNTVTFTLDDLPSASLPYDDDGYPVAPREDNDFYFQISGNTDGGQAYIDLYRQVGFRVDRTIDNKKSWAASGATARFDDSTPQYYQQDSKLLINTKEIDVTLDIARGIEYDVYCYNKNVEFPVTIPFLYINVPFEYGVSANTFTVPDIPLSGSSIQVNFNGVTLTQPTGDTSIATSESDYIRSGATTVILNDEYAITHSNGEKDIITLTYIHDKLGLTGFTEVEYIVQKPVVKTDGTEIYLAEEPKGDIQLLVDGISLSKGTSLFTGDYIIDDTDRTKVLIQNSDLQLYLQTNPIIRVWCIKDGGITSTAEKKSEIHRVDAIPSTRVGYDPTTNEYYYIMNLKALDVESIKLTLNGITLQNGTDFDLDNINRARINFKVNVKINFGDIIGVYYIIGDETYIQPLLPPDSTFPPIEDMSFLQYLAFINSRLINVKNRKTISDFNGGYYPTISKIYYEYLKRSLLPDIHPLKSNGYTFEIVYPFIERYNAFFNKFILKLLPATIITRKAGIMIRNTSFTRQKFMYRRGVNFDPTLQYLGDNGAEYVKRQPDSDCDWTEDYVCVEEVVPTTTTTTTTVPPTTTTTTTLPPTTTTTTTTEPTITLSWGIIR